MTARAQRDWKVTTGYRVLLEVGWAVIGVAIYFATAASLLDSMGVWWVVAGLALGAMILTAALPEPVPRDLITGPHAMVDARADRTRRNR